MVRKTKGPPPKPNPLAVRFRPEVLEFLRAEATRTGVTVNGLINAIATKHMHWRAGMERRKTT